MRNEYGMTQKMLDNCLTELINDELDWIENADGDCYMLNFHGLKMNNLSFKVLSGQKLVFAIDLF